MSRTSISDPIDVAVGARLRIRRQEEGLSQQALAARLGVTFQQVQKYERGANRISASMLVRAARALHCTGGSFLDEPGAEGGAVPIEVDAFQTELNALLSAPGAVELLRGFAAMRSSEARAGLLAVVRELAGKPNDAAPAGSPGAAVPRTVRARACVTAT
jgi:transcriptional regulator with XRE-family HTH domain